ncbi:MAG: DUF4870 domain-containing protein [Pseudomonadota bacterium]
MTEEMVVSQDERNIAALMHAGGIIFSFIPSLIVYLLKKDTSSFLADQSKEALNFQITVAIAFFVSMVLLVILVGALLLLAVFIINVVFCIIAALKASEGIRYRYPFALRLLK